MLVLQLCLRRLLPRFAGPLRGASRQAIASAPSLVRVLLPETPFAFDPQLDSIYLGGGTPSILAGHQLDRLFAAISAVFQPLPQAEITVEVAPGTLSDEVLAALLRARVNRVSLGVQSFVEQESRAVGRLHTHQAVLDDIGRLRDAGISNLSVDLIAGLPHQSAPSWERSLDEAISLGLPHLSVYMLEVDEDSRLGRELIAGGTRYHAHHVPDESLTVALYERAIERFEAAGIAQYEISNFARPGFQSQHNLRYWRRLPYFGFGVDAHSMLPAPTPAEPHRALRLATPDSLGSAAELGDLGWPTSAPPLGECGKRERGKRERGKRRAHICRSRQMWDADSTSKPSSASAKPSKKPTSSACAGTAASSCSPSKKSSASTPWTATAMLSPSLSPMACWRSKTDGCASPRAAACSQTKYARLRD